MKTDGTVKRYIYTRYAGFSVIVYVLHVTTLTFRRETSQQQHTLNDGHESNALMITILNSVAVTHSNVSTTQIILLIFIAKTVYAQVQYRLMVQ